jgi:hypothetical protein
MMLIGQLIGTQQPFNYCHLRKPPGGQIAGNILINKYPKSGKTSLWLKDEKYGNKLKY